MNTTEKIIKDNKDKKYINNGIEVSLFVSFTGKNQMNVD